MGARAPLLGRDREIDELEDFLRSGQSGGLVLTGEPGMGKSVLAEHAAELAAGLGALVLRAAPGEGEQRPSFGVLIDLFRETDHEAPPLRPPIRGALAAAPLTTEE